MLLFNVVTFTLICCVSCKQLMGYTHSADNNFPPIDKTRIGKGLLLYVKKKLVDTFKDTKYGNNPKFCAVYADDAALTRVAKVWIPYCLNNRKLWGDEKKVESYIGGLFWKYKVEKTLRLSVVLEDADEENGFDEVRVLIPPGLTNENGGAMGLTIECKNKPEDFPNEAVDLDKGPWNKNKWGRRGTAVSCSY